MRGKFQVLSVQTRNGIKAGNPWEMTDMKCFDTETNSFIEMDVRDRDKQEANTLVGKIVVLNVIVNKGKNGIRLFFGGQAVQTAAQKAA